MTHPLDHPVWSALSTRHGPLALGDAWAKRYPASIVPFAAAKDNTVQSLLSLERLVPPGDRIFMIQAEDIVLPPGLSATTTAQGVQMIAARSFPPVTDPRIQRLNGNDAGDMLALASLTKPGPFSLRAQDLGDFWGIRIADRLVAMAGERMKQPGFTELSGVCSHPDYRGKGLGRVLSLFVAGTISARGDIPYLHAYAVNQAAIALYESLGFVKRSDMHVAVVQRRDE